jgi:outer membrane protein OmpA-like peptidoglycan-associated protein
MRKRILLLFFLIFFFPFNVAAETTSEANSGATANLNYSPTYNSTGGDKRGFTGVYKVDPSVIGALPPIYKDEGWKIWQPTNAYKKPITMEKIEGLRKPSKGKPEVSSWATFPKNEEPIVIMSWYPQGSHIDEIGYVNLYGLEKYAFESIVMEGLKQAKKSTMTNHVVVFYRPKWFTVGKVRSLGTAGVIGKMMGPAGKSDQITGGGAMGSGIGTAKSFVDRNVEIKIVSFNDWGPPPKPTIEEKESPSELIKPFFAPHAIYFPFDKFNIVGQEKELMENASWIYSNWEAIKDDGNFIWAVGHCDKEGSSEYNDTLCSNRSKAVSIAEGRLLVQNGLNPVQVANKIRFVSSGKHQPQSDKDDINRRVDIFIGKTNPNLLPPPNYVNQR